MAIIDAIDYAITIITLIRHCHTDIYWLILRHYAAFAMKRCFRQLRHFAAHDATL